MTIHVWNGQQGAMSMDPYHDKKIYHLAKLISSIGNVSPLCAKKPRKLRMPKETWTNRPEAVTCKKCLTIMQKKEVTR